MVVLYRLPVAELGAAIALRRNLRVVAVSAKLLRRLPVAEVEAAITVVGLA